MKKFKIVNKELTDMAVLESNAFGDSYIIYSPLLDEYFTTILPQIYSKYIIYSHYQNGVLIKETF